MATCETCGNDYDKAFQVTMNGKAHTFDSFECAIHALAPTCDHCGIRIVGHGLEKDGTFYCCDHCAEREGVEGLRDRCELQARFGCQSDLAPRGARPITIIDNLRTTRLIGASCAALPSPLFYCLPSVPPPQHSWAARPRCATPAPAAIS